MRCTMIMVFICLFFSTVFGAIEIGDPSSTVSIDEVFDYQCPHCRRQLKQILALSDDKVAIFLHPTAVINRLSLEEVALVYAVGLSQQDVNEINALLLTSNIQSESELKNLMAILGMSYESWRPMMHSMAVKQEMLEGLDLLKQTHSNQVPLTLIRDSSTGEAMVLKGEQSQSYLRSIIRSLRKRETLSGCENT